MQMTFEKPKVEPLYQAEIYRTMQDGEEVFRVAIGMYGCEVPPKQGEFIDYHKISDFMSRKEIETWLLNQQGELAKKKGKSLNYDLNESELMGLALEWLIAESPIETEPVEARRLL